jgi:hypothetical protein
MTVDWASLQHAYGPAGDIPALLAQARTGDAPVNFQSEPWFTLWSSLDHQGDVYSASYAAVPELVDVAAERLDAVRVESLYLAACIELDRQSPRAPAIPEDLRKEYDQAIKRAAVLVDRADLAAVSPDHRQMLSIADAVFKGNIATARQLLDVD